ncbi:hypothetical protein [Bergeyella sp. RCAD1439]|uniref:hypothetical protein n=1 Tax=Bergeyella anatis TaxID=3113737 RepID=UPI002E183E05|nr:hypothetical protein [Bergeyella sp. RCAD1439]
MYSEVVLPKQEGYWGSKIYSHVNNAIADFNVYQNRMRLANAIQHSNAAQSVGRFEQFLFDEAPG